MRPWIAALAVAPLLLASPALADNEFTIVIKDHKFQPATLEVPAGQKLVLIVDNQDPTPEEFESRDFKAEKIIGGNRSAKVNVAPLKPGTYKFFGEFNMDTAQGVLIAK
ncbi:cupredoxin domain-containing protein [Azospirillum sp.]|uniref:cupredoxin domain-containing protein n=1 Tax=Azospirillum sp. TaxID=34012 RepID=UPI003D70EDC8